MCEARRPVRAISSSGRAFYPESTSAETDARSGGASRVARPAGVPRSAGRAWLSSQGDRKRVMFSP